MAWTPGTSEARSMRRLFRMRSKDAAAKGRRWELTLEQFQKLTSSDCFYCGKAPSQKSRSYTYNGIDRMENNGPYSVANSVSCCSDCNYIKGNRLTWEEMRVVANALKDFRRGEGAPFDAPTPVTPVVDRKPSLYGKGLRAEEPTAQALPKSDRERKSRRR